MNSKKLFSGLSLSSLSSGVFHPNLTACCLITYYVKYFCLSFKHNVFDKISVFACPILTVDSSLYVSLKQVLKVCISSEFADINAQFKDWFVLVMYICLQGLCIKPFYSHRNPDATLDCIFTKTLVKTRIKTNSYTERLYETCELSCRGKIVTTLE